MKSTNMLILGAGMLASRAAAAAADVSPRAPTCGKEMQICAPSGATTSHLSPLGPSLSTLYIDLLETVSGIHFTKRSSSSTSSSSSPLSDANAKRDDSDTSAAFCCSTATTCLLLSSSTCPGSIPLCYDKYTTNFALPDGTTGTVAAGSLSLPDGSSADLLTGAYTNASAHVSGNLYDDSLSSSSSSPSASAAAAPKNGRPNTATLAIPPVFTAAGVGSAIPLSALGTLLTSVDTRAAPQTDARGSTVATATTRSAPVLESTVTGAATTGGAAAASASKSSGTASGSSSSSSPTPSGFTGAADRRGGGGGMGLLALAVGGAAFLL